MKWDKNTNQWQNYSPERDDVFLLESNQILAIQSAAFEDTGSYKCKEQNSSASVDLKKFNLHVVACDKLARGPFPVSPLPCAETIAAEKETITLPCTGYFGCGDDGDIRIVMWYVSEDTDDNWKETSEVDDRYTTTKFEEDSGTVVGLNLTIKSVSAVDFRRKFMCLLASPQMIKSQSSTVVTLRNKNRIGEDPMLKSGFDSGEVLIVLAVVSVCLLILTGVLAGLFIQRQMMKSRKSCERKGNHQQWETMTYKSTGDSVQMLP